MLSMGGSRCDIDTTSDKEYGDNCDSRFDAKFLFNLPKFNPKYFVALFPDGDDFDMDRFGKGDFSV